jgi:tRNA dimethylallyltransferase
MAPQPSLRAALAAWQAQIGAQGLHDRLATVDPKAAAKIDPRNSRRTQRALEVLLASGRRYSEQRLKHESPYSLLQIGLTRKRKELYERLDVRIEAMLAAGWLAEVRALLAKGYSASLPSMSAIGYAQLARHLAGEVSFDHAVAEIKRKTRFFVRRQAAWFKPSDSAIAWLEASDPNVVDAIESKIRGFLHP